MLLDRDTQYLKSIDLKRENISSYRNFPLNLPVIQHFRKLDFHPNVTYIIGENGMGKSTLLEAIAVSLGFNPEGGSLNFNFSSFDSHSNLHEYIRIAKGGFRPTDSFFFRAESYYNLATNIEELDKGGNSPRIIDSFGGTSLHEQSHGESFFATFIHRLQGKGLYILDEPEAALSPLRQMSLLARIHELIHDESQLIISTHSPIIMAYPEAKIIQLTEMGMEETTLENTNHYKMMEQFFEDRDRLLHHLFGEANKK
ncbi:AAA family ATPase [Ornithinibacillus halotolerans]|uniref:ABC transporter ATP-binding protein n=1 Tax=Ornithinibacillus halotolerans TaxID=1274357 RepID=A0A916W6F3_9BACI|nr:AAA family ATPase [Ornithinibacillus halotolerans]GGA71912.1 ABC transporter ATP-binding protein [Ornithinibacillus halotolerans]